MVYQIAFKNYTFCIMNIIICVSLYNMCTWICILHETNPWEQLYFSSPFLFLSKKQHKTNCPLPCGIKSCIMTVQRTSRKKSCIMMDNALIKNVSNCQTTPVQYTWFSSINSSFPIPNFPLFWQILHQLFQGLRTWP